MPPQDPLNDLTVREHEVLDLIRLGLTNEEIAGRLAITEAGVKYHVSQILSKLGVTTREEAAVALAPRRRWWAALPLAAKAAGIAVMVAAVAGLGLLAWGVLRTNGEGNDATAFAPQMPTSSARVALTSEVTPWPLPPCLTEGTENYNKISVEPNTVAVGDAIVVRGTGRYFVVLSPLYGLSPRPCPPESWPIPIPGGFPEATRKRANGCELAVSEPDASRQFEVTVRIPETCTTLNGDEARVLPGTYMIWDTTTQYPPFTRPAAWLTITE